MNDLTCFAGADPHVAIYRNSCCRFVCPRKLSHYRQLQLLLRLWLTLCLQNIPLVLLERRFKCLHLSNVFQRVDLLVAPFQGVVQVLASLLAC